jgi:hypothetical protein
MKREGLNLWAWTYQGQKMPGLHSMARRALCLPVIWLGKGIIFTGALLGWGLEEAKYIWKELP